MYHQLNLNKTLGWTLFLALLVSPAAAYKVEGSEDVAGTWHIEPNDSSLALEPARTWIPFTREGGQILPKEQGNYQLARLTEQEGDRDWSQRVPQWIVNAIGIEIGITLAALTTLVRRILKRTLNRW